MLDNSRLFFMKLFYKGCVQCFSTDINLWDQRAKQYGLYDKYVLFKERVQSEYNNDYEQLDVEAKKYLYSLFNYLYNDINYIKCLSFSPDLTDVKPHSKNYGNKKPKYILSLDLRKALYQIYEYNKIPLTDICNNLTDSNLLKNSTLYVNLFDNYRNRSALDLLGRYYPYYKCYINDYKLKSLLMPVDRWHEYALKILYDIHKSSHPLIMVLNKKKCPYLIKGDHIEYIIDNCFDDIWNMVDLNNDITIDGHPCHINIFSPHYIKYKSKLVPEELLYVNYDIYSKDYGKSLVQIKRYQNFYVPQFYKALNSLDIIQEDLNCVNIVNNELVETTVDKIDIIDIIK